MKQLIKYYTGKGGKHKVSKTVVENNNHIAEEPKHKVTIIILPDK